MKIYEGTGKTKTDELRVTRSIGALWLTSSKTVDTLVNEKITIFFESPNGKNIEIASNISLKHFILGATYGSSKIKSDTFGGVGLSAICELSSDGSVGLGTDEVLKISLTGLNPAESYSINGIEFPQGASHIITYDRKTMLSEESQRTYKVVNADIMMLDATNVTEIEMTYNNGLRISHDIDELRALAFDVEDIITVDLTTVSTGTGGVLMFPMVDVNEIRIDKSADVAELTLVNFNY